jgi:FkbM family methyltransferase
VREGRASYLANVLAYRVLAMTPRVPGVDGVHRLVTDGGAVVYYRRNRGDVQGIREIFIDEIYRLPEGASPSSLVDLGANIGLATIWLCREYQIASFVALEPMPANFELLERNCRANALDGDLRCVAAGATSGAARFDAGAETNLGRVGHGELVVDVVGITTLVNELGFGGSLLKVDVEGAEAELFLTCDPGWVREFEFVAIELHPQYFDIAPVIAAIEGQGFEYFAPVEVSRGTTRSKRERLFVRRPTTLRR